MKRRDLVRRLEAIAKELGRTMTITEGANHSVVRLDGKVVSTIPRHNEINELTAQAIIKVVRGV